MTAPSNRPTTLEEALRALDAAEAKLRSRENDETGIRRLTESVLRSEERFRALAEGVPNHLLFLDNELRIVFANDVFLEAFGWSAKKVVGLHISDIVGTERFLERQQYYERALAGETVSYDSTGAAGSAPIYVLTSPWTFSAAITTVAALKDEGGRQVIIVGEEVGDRLDFWAEGGSFELPNAFLLANYAAGRHVYDGPCRNLNQCFWLDYRYPVRVSSLAPDIAAPLTFAAYRENRDPAMEAVLAREARRDSSARRR